MPSLQRCFDFLELTRRWLFFLTVSLWFGGFLFYTAFVVPVGNDVLGSALDQGMITRLVTHNLNAVNVIALFALAWDVAATWRAMCLRMRVTQIVMFLLVAVGLALLVWLHPQLDAMIDPVKVSVSDRAAFRPIHRWYLRVSTIQWAAMLIYIAVMLVAWRKKDGTKVVGDGQV